MTLAEAIDEFRRERQSGRADADSSQTDSADSADSIDLFGHYLLTRQAGACASSLPDLLRDFFSRWYVEHKSSKQQIAPRTILSAIAGLLRWRDARDHSSLEADCSPLLYELSATLPRALDITAALSKHVAERGGAFSFPEFLTTFADGGQSSYDIAVAGDGEGPGAVEGYFRIVKVEGLALEVQELISEERYWPVLCPDEVARLVEPRYIVNIEIIRVDQGWQIVACGFAYPPATDL